MKSYLTLVLLRSIDIMSANLCVILKFYQYSRVKMIYAITKILLRQIYIREPLNAIKILYVFRNTPHICEAVFPYTSIIEVHI